MVKGALDEEIQVGVDGALLRVGGNDQFAMEIDRHPDDHLLDPWSLFRLCRGHNRLMNIRMLLS